MVCMNALGCTPPDDKLSTLRDSCHMLHLVAYCALPCASRSFKASTSNWCGAPSSSAVNTDTTTLSVPFLF